MTTIKYPTIIVQFSDVKREFNALSTQMCFITEELASHVEAAIKFLEYPRTKDEIYQHSIHEFEVDPDEDSTDHTDNQIRRRIRTAVVLGLKEAIEEQELRDDTGRLRYRNFELGQADRTLLLKE